MVTLRAGRSEGVFKHRTVGHPLPERRPARTRGTAPLWANSRPPLGDLLRRAEWQRRRAPWTAERVGHHHDPLRRDQPGRTTSTRDFAPRCLTVEAAGLHRPEKSVNSGPAEHQSPSSRVLGVTNRPRVFIAGQLDAVRFIGAVGGLLPREGRQLVSSSSAKRLMRSTDATGSNAACLSPIEAVT